jgi:iron complex transport system ATP-binding protein
MLTISNVSVSLDNKKIVDNVSFELKENDLATIIGPNGAGKTTLIKAIMGVLPYEGNILLEGKPLSALKPRQLARRIGVLTQKHQPQFEHTVYDVVSMGRYAYVEGFLGRLGQKDREKIEEALYLTGTENLKHQSVLTLSGGELQRVFLAQLFAQDPQILILDEPTNHLDLKYQIALFDMIKEWSMKKGRAVLAVVHDLNMVYTYASKALLMDGGRTHAQGAVKEVLSRENLKSVYKVDVAEWMQNLLHHWS